MPSSRRSATSKSSRRRVRYLSYDDLTTIAFKLAERLFSDWLDPMPVLVVLGGERAVGRVDGILKLARQSAGGRPAYPSLYDKAAVLFRSFILNHPFVDGNKRIATAASLVFLDINNEVACATQREMVDLALSVASGRTRSLTELSVWFGAHSRKLSDISLALTSNRLPQLVESLPGAYPLEDRVLLVETVRDLQTGQS